MTNSILEKIAELSEEDKRELIHTGTIGASGFATGIIGAHAAERVAKRIPKMGGKLGMGAMVGTLGLLGDYGVVKLNKKIDQHLDKEASEVSNRYLEKIASVSEIAKGWISPAWMESSIAKEYDTTTDSKSLGAAYGSHLGGTYRAVGRGYLEGLGGAVIGTGVGAMVNGGAGASVGALLGAAGGLIHGTNASLINQADEMHRKYREKTASVILSKIAETYKG